ncbi:uncharacterized protein LOC124176922 [Neodiprion fabricii]|uniref:uncharacterized protein LOC124176922 n=1 Tax=Neodiprion fabricii TaxID=2872261 RepID=UPI001ED9448F|nr:uncharacterized protein LOC124176922 [Neodiprion fabricii]
MGHLLQLVIGLFTCLSFTNALPALFPKGKITTYRYYADVKAGTFESTPFASQFAIAGFLHVTPEVGDKSLKNAFYMSLNVTHGIRNGAISHSDKIENNFLPLADIAGVLNDPFIVVFDDNGKVKNLLVNGHEAGWSVNMKKSIVSILQLDVSAMKLETPIKSHLFVTRENTVYGECSVTYNLKGAKMLGEKHFTVTKNMDPMSCTKFDQDTFDSQEFQGCLIPVEEDVNAVSRRVFQIENNVDHLLIKTVHAHGVLNYFPWRTESEAHYILVNQTIDLESVESLDSISLAKFDIQTAITVSDIAFEKSRSTYAVDAGIDHTYGRHVVNLEILVTKLIKLLEEAADYMLKNNVEIVSPEAEHGQKMNHILDVITLMDVPSLEEVLKNIAGGGFERNETITKLFLHVVPYAGTNATTLFTRNNIRNGKIEEMIALSMLGKLANYIRFPTEELLVEMEDLMSLGSEVPLDVRKAGILTFATMIYKTHKHQKYYHTLNPALVSKYVNHYFDHVMSETSFDMKLVYIYGMRNIQIGDVHKLLEPIVRGDLKVSKKPEYIRFHAIMVFWRAPLATEYIDELFWPLMADTELMLSIRIWAYNILLEKSHRIDRLMQLYWFMTEEKNEHLYNHYYTTIKSLAHSANPCLIPVKEKAAQILRVITLRENSDTLTGFSEIDYENKKFGFGEAAKVFIAYGEENGAPTAAFIEYDIIKRRKPINAVSVWIRVEGFEFDIVNDIMDNDLKEPHLHTEKIEALLKRASQDMPRNKPIHIEVMVMVQGRTVLVRYYDEDTFSGKPELTHLIRMAQDMKLGLQDITFDELYAMQVPNDLGLPTLFYNKVPHVMALQGKVTGFEDSALIAMKIEAVLRDWRDGYYSMEVYNPIIDAWHAVRRVSAFEVSLPFAMSIGLNLKTASLKLIFPRLPLTQYSVTGVRLDIRNYVLVMDAEQGILHQHCPSCHPIELVSKGSSYRKNTTLLNYDSKDTGLSFSVNEYNCERDVAPGYQFKLLTDMLDDSQENFRYDDGIFVLATLREYYLYTLNYPERGMCGYIMKVEPSAVYPTSEFTVSMHFDHDIPISKKLSLFPAEKYRFDATFETTAAITKAPRQTWTVKGQFSSPEGHVNDHLRLHVTRIIPGQKNLKICLDNYNSYPTTQIDPFDQIQFPKQKSYTNLTLFVGETEDDACVDDGISVMITGKAQLSDEQREGYKNAKDYGLCQKDVDNPSYLYAETSIIPRTPNCLSETIQRTTLRKYIYSISYANISGEFLSGMYLFLDYLRLDSLQYLTYDISRKSLPGHIEVSMEYSMNDKFLNLTILNPTYGEIYTGIEEDDDEGWTYLMENTLFSSSFLDDIREKNLKFCTIYPDVLLDADGGVHKIVVPGEWTLLTGDHVDHLFAVFVKSIEPKKLGMMMSIANHTIEAIPSSSGPKVIVDGLVIDHENGVIVPEDEDYVLRTAWHYNRLLIETTYAEFTVEWTGISVMLMMEKDLQGKVMGLCGHLDGKHKYHMAKVYTLDAQS